MHAGFCYVHTPCTLPNWPKPVRLKLKENKMLPACCHKTTEATVCLGLSFIPDTNGLLNRFLNQFLNPIPNTFSNRFPNGFLNRLLYRFPNNLTENLYNGILKNTLKKNYQKQIYFENFKRNLQTFFF